MILKKKLKAGILLQAIVLAAVFTLVLQFYRKTDTLQVPLKSNDNKASHKH
ncbi:TPA: hypothetical protein VAY26_001178 [Streptococcus agalactiae]|nr:hypothetical protein [Streptococcus agalactiae]